MDRRVIRTLAALVVGGLIATAGPAVALPVNGPAPLPQTPAWVETGRGSRIDDLAVSGDGSIVYAAGTWWHQGNVSATLTAHDVATGAVVWRFVSGRNSYGESVTLSPDGDTIVLAGSVQVEDSRYFAVAAWALDAQNGRNLWSARRQGTGAPRGDWAYEAAFTPDGSRLIMAGLMWNEGTRRDIAVLAYQARTGKLAWRRIIDSGQAKRGSKSKGISDLANALAISPNGKTVVITGLTGWVAGEFGAAATTLAFETRTGAQRWRHDLRLEDFPGGEHTGVDVSIDRGQVLVAGRVASRQNRSEPAAFAMRIRIHRGTPVWTQTANLDGATWSESRRLATASGNVIVAGRVRDLDGADSFRAWAHRDDRGAMRWEVSIGRGYANDVVAMPDRGSVVVAGTLLSDGLDGNLAVAGIDAATGEARWIGQHEPVGTPTNEVANVVVVTPDGSTVIAGGAGPEGELLAAFAVPS